MKERGVDCDDMTYIDKPTFGSKELGELLAGYDNSDIEIYFCGFCTGICVISNVAIAKTFCKEAEVSVIENACACVTPESHKTAIEAMKMIQVNII
jgi:nicotinamidase-related amidase